MGEINPKEVKIGAEALSGGVARIALLGIGFVGSVVFARVLGATGFGAFYLLVTLENVIDRPVIGLSESVQKRLSEAETDPEEYFGAFLLGFATFLTFIIILTIVYKDPLNDYIQRSDAYLLFAVLLLTLSAQESFSKILAATGRLGLVNWIDTLRSFITIPLQVLLILSGYGVVGMTVGLGVASLITPVLVIYLLGIRPAFPNLKVFGSLLEYGKYSIPNSITSFGYDRIALLVLGYYLSPNIVGYFEAALKLTVPALAIGAVASGALMPKISNLSSRGENFTQELRNVMSYSSVFAIPIFFGAVALSHKLMITVYGSGFGPGSKFLTGIALYRVITTRTKPLVSTLRGLDLPNLDLIGTIISSTILLAVGVPGLLRFGAMGMLLGILAAALSRYILNTVFVKNQVGEVPHYPKPFLAQIVGGVVMLIFLEIAKKMVIVSPWYRVFLLVGLGALIYFVVVVSISSDVRSTVIAVGTDFAKQKLDRPLK
ncbi:MAG: lipopolysaccharide biosynthesis protein [Halopenitus sp.]